MKYRTALWLLQAALSAFCVAVLHNASSAKLIRPLSGPGSAQSATPAQTGSAERVVSAEGITEYRLPNGLRALLFPDQSKQTITVNITYLVGSRHENYGESGMAHLLEHLVFKGTPRRPNMPKEFSDRGAQFNGTTWFERTNYFETFPATEENLKWALDLEADRMVNSFISKKDLDSEFTVVRNEMEMGENDPFNILWERVGSSAYNWHNYGNSTIGARSDVENVPIDRLQAFYKSYYQPDNAILLVAGKFDEAMALDLINKYFGAIPRPTRELPKFYTVEPVQDGERVTILRRVGAAQVVLAGYHIPAGTHRDAPAIDALTQILSDSPSGRLHKTLIETKKASKLHGYCYQLRDPGLLILGAETPREASLDSARDALIQTIENLIKEPPTNEEVTRARNQLLKQIELNLNSSDQVGVELSEWMAMGDWRLLFVHRQRLQNVTVEDVTRVAAAYLKPSNRTLGLFIPTPKPDRAEIPAAPDLSEVISEYKGGAAVTAGEAFEATPANIDGRTIRKALPSGLKLALLPKKTRGNNVVAQLTIRLGAEKSLTNRRSAGLLTASMLERGTVRRTRQQLKDEFDRLKSRVSFSPGSIDILPAVQLAIPIATEAYVSIQTTRENFPEVMRLVAEALREPAFAQTEFDHLKQEELTKLEQQRDDPIMLNFNASMRHALPYPKGHPRYLPTFDEAITDLKSVSLDDVKKFYADFFGASSGELAVVGDFDANEITKLTGELLGDWKSAIRFARVPEVYRDLPPVEQKIDTPDKAMAMTGGIWLLNLRDDDPDYPALELANWLLGAGGPLSDSRLPIRLRQKEGLSYGVGALLFTSSLDKRAIFFVGGFHAPQNLSRFEAALKEELDRALKDGFTEEEMKAAKSSFLQQVQVARSQDPALVKQLGAYYFLDRTFAWDVEIEKKIQALSPEQILTAIRKHIPLRKMAIIKVGDWAKAGSR